MKIIDLKNIPGIITSYGSFSDKEIKLTTDSRDTSSKNVFLALKGENFDGFNYVTSVLEEGVQVIIYTDCIKSNERALELVKVYPQAIFIGVKNSLKYLQDCASWWVRKWQSEYGGVVLGITGSNAKTTTKELLFAHAKNILGDKVMCTAGNYNNHIGVPLTIFNINKNHEFAIIEMGTNHPGEIEVLCNIANPDYGLITNIGAAHLEFFKDELGVLQEKSALYRYIVANGRKFYLNLEDDNLKTLEKVDKVITFDQETFKSYPKNNNIREEFNVWNYQVALMCIDNIFPEYRRTLEDTAPNVKLPNNKRSQWIEKDNKTFLLDAYNANPSSMAKAIESFASSVKENKEKTLFVLGDMNELGDKSGQYHKEIGMLLNELEIDHAIFVGRFAQFYAEGFKGKCISYKSTSELKQEWNKVSNSYQYIFLKGSRALQLEALIDINV